MDALEPLRTLLFVPGNRPDRIDKALQSQADAVIIDLEDAVPIQRKKEARDIVKNKIQEHAGGKIFVRVNALNTEFFEEDIQEIAVQGVSCIVIPKVEKASDMLPIEQCLTQAEKNNGFAQGSIQILPLIETALAVQNIVEIVTEKTAQKRMVTSAFGAADFTLDMGIDMTLSAEELMYPRARIAVACRAANLQPPIDSPFMIDLQDLKALEKDARRSKKLGYQGKLCIHPNQLDICNTVYSPSDEETAFARKVLKAFHEAETSGHAAIQVDGKFIDYPIVTKAQRIVALAKRLSQ
ncbi:MAG: CoA ester lyase [Desulfohalobiaceae bacterium]|nr:CoA ester lyase [Desulfohalobiaceae bacterium]